MNRVFVTGIGTNVGKTIASAILVEALKADYWKPIQAGELDITDTMKVKELVSSTNSVFYPEAYRLTSPLSPHAAAEIDGLTIDFKKIIAPNHHNPLIIEGAGGVMVPLNNELLILDLIQYLEAKVVLVSHNYLGSINHTLLTIEALKHRNIPIAGIIFNGTSVPSTEEYILNYTGLKCLLRIEKEETITRTIIKNYAKKISYHCIVN